MNFDTVNFYRIYLQDLSYSCAIYSPPLLHTGFPFLWAILGPFWAILACNTVKRYFFVASQCISALIPKMFKKIYVFKPGQYVYIK